MRGYFSVRFNSENSWISEGKLPKNPDFSSNKLE